ncbi:MAG: CsgG/HfaB family protein [Proteobacteria bacterium]|nr:CsgG/HfaB family protein [Pseudomonadota bacterium]MBU1685857.1 CsgG/HfaB family protein [Pseudomonadota bacterium]
MKIHIWFLVLLFVSGVGFAGADDGSEVAVTSEGFGVTRDEALLQAKREAVAVGIGTVLISETEVNNFVLRKDVVLTRTIGAVKSFRVLGENQPQGDDLYQVQIEARVSLANIRGDLAAMKILLESMDKPRMMVVIREEGGRAAETRLLEILREKGFDVVDAAAVAALTQNDGPLIDQAVAGDPAAAIRLGAAQGAEYIIVGQVAGSLANNALLARSGMVSGQAELSARVIDCSTGRVVAGKTVTGAAAHVSEIQAREKAAVKAVEKLMDRGLLEQIIASFQDMVNNGRILQVTIRDIPDYRTQLEVDRIIRELPVISVEKRGFREGALMLDVVYGGAVDGFAGGIDGRTVNEKVLSVIEVTGNRVVLRLQ